MKAAIIILFVVSLLSAVPSFPGAEGWGAASPGGRGGKVFIVTTTASSGTGSLRAALQATGPRIIVFRVSGPINIQAQQWDLVQGNSNVTVAGQTSPGGVTVTGSGGGTSLLWHYVEGNYIQVHDIVLRFLRFRGTGNNEHAIALTYAHNFIFDHCDFSGGFDECFDMTHDSTFTVQWCTVANSTPDDASWGGFLTGYNPTCNLSIHHNLFANHRDRCGILVHWLSEAPVKDGLIDFRNNTCYNVSDVGYMISISLAATPAHINLVGNYLKSGPATPTIWNRVSVSTTATYSYDNYCDPAANDQISTTPGPIPANRIGNLISPAWAVPAVTTQTVQQAHTMVLNKAGAWPRDSMNNRTVMNVRTRTGTLYTVGDPLIQTGPAAPADADMDGMPNFWENGMGLNPNDSSDYRTDKDNDGYTNLEEYINDLALARLCEDYHNPVYPIPSDWPDYNPACCKPLAAEKAAGKADVRHTLTVSPNPYSGRGALRMSFPDNRARGMAEIVDLRGSVAARIQVRNGAAVWGGPNGELAPGIYLVRFAVGTCRVTTRLVTTK